MHESKKPLETYIIDFLNVFSDYREMLYKKQKLDFHTFKDANLQTDLENYFVFFTEKFIEKLHLKTDAKFIFIIKKIPLIESFLPKLLKTYSNFNFEFLIIYSKLNNQLFDKNKDDVLCKFLYNYIPKSIVITNDLYSDMKNYIYVFDKVSIVFVIYKNFNGEEHKSTYSKVRNVVTIDKKQIKQNFERKCLSKKYIQKLI
jgi:hypothetical protein